MLAPTPFFSDRGCHIRVLNSYLRLKKEGHNITMITYPLGRNVLNIKPIRVKQLPGYRKKSPGFSMYKPLLDVMMYCRAKKEMAKTSYDLIYAHLHEGALIGIFLKKKFRSKLIFDSQGSLAGELLAGNTIRKKSITYKFVSKLEKYITEKPDEIITSTDGLKKFIQKEFKFTKKIEVIKDLPDKSLFNEDVQKAKVDLPKKRIAVYLGGLQLYKGIKNLLQAIPFTDKKFHFLIMGYPINDAQKLAKKLGVEDRITFTGQIPYEKAASYLRLGDVAISPKTLESGEANAKIYNYVAVGLPVVCFDIPENREILGKEGFYAKPGNIKDLAKKIELAGAI